MKVDLLSITSDAERVVEKAGRTAYQSFDRMNEDSAAKFISTSPDITEVYHSLNMISENFHYLFTSQHTA